MSIDSYGIHLGPLYVQFYGIILMVGALVGTYIASYLLKDMDEESDPELLWDALVWVLIFGVIGARLYHVFTPSKSLLAAGIDTRYYLTHPIDLIASWQGGLGIPGAVIGGVFGMWIFARRRGLELPLLLDAAAPAVAIGQAIGRWGNFVNQELYGPPTTLPWGIYIRPENRLPGFAAFDHFHPLFLYESLLDLANAALLYWLWRRYGSRMLRGDLFLIYLVTYPLIRFGLEFLRIDFVPLFGINFNQTLMLVIALASAGFLYWRHRQAMKVEETPQPPM
jgi:phosphatidylglycerol---prolipoprotein diacylglyceryl transferase